MGPERPNRFGGVFISVSASHGRTAANGGHPRGVRAEGMWPASAKISPAVIGSHGVPAGRVLRCDTNTRLFRLTRIKINKRTVRAAGALLDGGQPLYEQRRHSRVTLLPRLFFRRQGAVSFLGGAAARGRRRAAALSVTAARARAHRRRARRVASTGGRRRRAHGVVAPAPASRGDGGRRRRARGGRRGRLRFTARGGADAPRSPRVVWPERLWSPRGGSSSKKPT